ncbi:evolutionarily conserved signaling intermediate in Toll pathway, mitochondrial [Chelonus insularis]|uniref:evolutionarily conserved signaling intermediate in Toll pathway, mitochondrial n=1 Tax=Chelonus insularis TaxID=460826 RepID=UPI00158BF9D0|nr:evolutionarily conserved signaling intermediate in Toll pathway, mitochondrial [Chelonus insularis]
MLPTMKMITPKNLRSMIELNRILKNVRTFKPTNSRYYHITNSLKFKDVNEEDQKKSVALFDAAHIYHKKTKEAYLDVLRTYTSEQDRKIGHVRFIYAALRYMKEFGVEEDLEAYKALLDTLPKGRYVAKSLFMAEMSHYPREQQCIIDLLQQMEDNGVVPDPEMELMVINIFGQYGFPLRKLRSMAYWQGKFKNINPWPIPRPLPSSTLEIAKIAIQKIASVDVTSVITVFNTEDIKDSIDKTWIVSASSPDQEHLIASHPTDVPAYVEGPNRIWVGKISVDYFILYTEPTKRPPEEDIDNDDVSNMDISLWRRAKKKLVHRRSIHEQDKMTIFGVCATGTSTKDSLLSWIRCLQIRNPALEKIPILFKFRSQEELQRIASGIEKETKKIEG